MMISGVGQNAGEMDPQKARVVTVLFTIVDIELINEYKGFMHSTCVIVLLCQSATRFIYRKWDVAL
jgi:hypothetical protein